MRNGGENGGCADGEAEIPPAPGGQRPVRRERRQAQEQQKVI
jgi:hypothetical protein